MTTAASCDLLLVLAHPDDETFMGGGTLAHYARRGCRGGLLCYTDGQAGRMGLQGQDPLAAREDLGTLRREELRRASAELSIHELITPGWQDGGLADVDELAGVALAVQALRALRPRVVISFGKEGAPNRHPDHIASARWAEAAVTAAADPQWSARATAELQRVLLRESVGGAPPEPLAQGWLAAQQAGTLAPHQAEAYYWITWPPEADLLRGTAGAPTTHRVRLDPEAAVAKLRAFDAHRTQHDHRETFLALQRHFAGHEHFFRVDLDASALIGAPASELLAPTPNRVEG